jgi:hypothetical protein
VCTSRIYGLGSPERPLLALEHSVCSGPALPLPRNGCDALTMREADRRVEERLSILDRPRSDQDSPSHPRDEHSDRPPFFEPTTVRLAINEAGRRIFVARGAASEHADDICVLVDGPSGGGGSRHPRSALRATGVTISWEISSSEPGVVVYGAVADHVSAVSVDGVDAIVRNNAYLAVVASAAESIVVTTPDGERRVDITSPRPPH